MPAFDIELMSPIGSGFTRSLGGPNVGGHVPPEWYIQFGMDLGAPDGTEVRASFDGHVSKFFPHDRTKDNGKVFGAQIFVRDPSDRMGCFYTHLTEVPDTIAVGRSIARGDLIGRIFEFGGITSHVHMAVCEIFGTVETGERGGVDLHNLYVNLSGADQSAVVTFAQERGVTPQVGGVATPTSIDLSTLRGVQRGLLALGFDPQGIDGIDGPNTRAAVSALQESQGIEPDGVAVGETLTALAALLTANGVTITGVEQ